MHISDGVLSPVITGITSVAAAGMVTYALVGIKEKELPKVALMAAAFCVGSAIHFRVGPSSVHLLLTGVIGLLLGKRAPLALFMALLFQLVAFQYGGITSLGANILTTSIPAVLVGMGARKAMRRWNHPLPIGALAGGVSVLGTVLLVILLLIESNVRYGIGILSAARLLFIGHVPVMVVEAFVTAFVFQYMVNVRPEMIKKGGKNNESEST